MTPAPHLSFGLALTACAGFADAVGFIVLGGHYVSFMSGNTTQLGDAFAAGAWSAASLAGALVALFFGGSFGGSLLALIAGPRWGSAAVTLLVFATLALTLGLAWAGVAPASTMLVLAAGAGAQNAILPSTGSVRLGTTFVTGTLFNAGLDLARALRGFAPPWRWAQHLLVWGSLMLGAVAGSAVFTQAGVWSLFVPAAIYLCFAAAFVLRPPSMVIR